jgi:hypothetical protein
MVGQSRIGFCKTSKENFNNSTIEAATAAYPTGSRNIAEADSHLLITFISTPQIDHLRRFSNVAQSIGFPAGSDKPVNQLARKPMCRKLPIFTRPGHQSIGDRFSQSKVACQGRFICVDVERRKNAVGVMRDAR